MTQASPFDFLAVLIYDDGEDRYSEEPHVIRAAHPEIAYRIALREERKTDTDDVSWACPIWNPM